MSGLVSRRFTSSLSSSLFSSLLFSDGRTRLTVWLLFGLLLGEIAQKVIKCSDAGTRLTVWLLFGLLLAEIAQKVIKCSDPAPAHRLITFWLAFGENRSKSNQMLCAGTRLTIWLLFGLHLAEIAQKVIKCSVPGPGSPFDYFLACFWRKSLKK